MHIPDGFLSPATWLSATAVALPAWWWASRGLRQRLDDQTLPRLAAVTALAYSLGLVMLPLPGATSGHLSGAAILALMFGLRLSFLAFSVVLLLQALLFGAGGITAWATNVLAMGLLGAGSALVVYRLLRRLNEDLAVALAAWVSIMVTVTVLALVLGAQPIIAARADGQPLYFPFGWSVVVPAMLVPHALIGLAEAALTLALWRFARARRWPGLAPAAS